MGISGGGGTKSSSTSSSISGSAQAWAKPYAIKGAGAVQSVFDQNQPGIQALSNYAQGDLLSNLRSKLGQSQGAAGLGLGYASDVLGGKYMQGNPYLQGVIDNAGDDIMGRMNGQFSHAGRYGSEVHQGEAMKQLANMENQLRYQDYATQQGRMDSMAQLSQQAAGNDATQVLAALQTGAELPYTGSNNLANALGALFNGGTSNSTSKSVTKGPGLLQSLIAGGAQAAGAAAAAGSERRIKKNIVKVGTLPDGLNVYDFDYREGFGQPEGRFRGVMVDEVEKLRPHALGPVINGIQTVDYSKIAEAA